MITKFQTSATPATSKSDNGGGILVFLGLAAVAAWLGYEYWYKPMKEEEAKKESEKKEEVKA